jgi:Holliday junction DNA helicase RuvB
MKDISPLSAKKTDEDEDEKSLRPDNFNEFIGQTKIIENLKIFIKSAKMRREALDHVLLAGPPGLGKTTLAFITAKELRVNIKATSAPMIEKTGDMA